MCVAWSHSSVQFQRRVTIFFPQCTSRKKCSRFAHSFEHCCYYYINFTVDIILKLIFYADIENVNMMLTLNLCMIYISQIFSHLNRVLLT